jgi:hypothetical protein
MLLTNTIFAKKPAESAEKLESLRSLRAFIDLAGGAIRNGVCFRRWCLLL